MRIGDNITEKFQTLLDVESFTVAVPEAHLDMLPQILEGIRADIIAAKQRALGHVWHRCRPQLGPWRGKYPIGGPQRLPSLW